MHRIRRFPRALAQSVVDSVHHWQSAPQHGVTRIRNHISALNRCLLTKVGCAVPRSNAVNRAPSKSRSGTLGDRLGFNSDERLLIVHADDLGIARSINAAFASGIATGLINSGSAIVPGQHFSGLAAFAQTHPEADIGLHLTVTSDSASDPWAPAAPRESVPSLIDEQGIFHKQWTPATRINPYEVEIELRAQIEKARAAGLRPTHLDSHRFRLLLSGEKIFRLYLRVGREYRLPV